MRIAADQAFIVTGAASGLGAATARRLRAAGAQVLLADVHDSAAESVANDLQCSFVHCDVTRESDAAAAVNRAQKLAPLRGLVNCAGVAPAMRTLGKDGPHPLEAFTRVVNINLIGSFNMARLAAAAIAQQDPLDDGERGVIIHTASIAAFDGQTGQAAYAASKAGLVGMTLPMARDLARDGIRVMTVAPGIFETPMLMDMPEPVRAALAASIPFPPRLGRPDEFAMLVEAIIHNPMLNGETIRLDGAIRMQAK